MSSETEAAVNLELKQKTLEAVNFITTEVSQNYQAGKTFVAEQAPLAVAEMLHWGLASHAMGCILGLSGLMISTYMLRKLFDRDPELIIGFWFAFFASLFVFLPNVYEFIKVLVAPRLYLLEEAASMIK